MAVVAPKPEFLALRPLDWGPQARASLPSRRFSQDDITVGYGGLRINEKRFSVQIGRPLAAFASPQSAVGLPSLVGSIPPRARSQPRRKRGSAVGDSDGAVGATCRGGTGSTVTRAPGGQEEHQRKIVLVFLTIGVGILLISVLLVTITLRLSPRIDEMVRKENEELLKMLQSSGSTNGGIQDPRASNSSGGGGALRSSPTPPPISEG